MRLMDQVAIVTGGASGIGAAICRAFSHEGAYVAVLDIDDGAATKFVDTLPRALALHCDVSQSRSVNTAIDAVAKQFGRIDILVNNAGVLGTETLHRRELQMEDIAAGRKPAPLDVTVSLSDEHWRAMIATHLDGTFYCSRAALRHMRDRGRGAIINMSSIAGLSASAGSPHYSAAKAGILGFTRALAREVIVQGVRVNALAPGFVETPLRDLFSERLQAAQNASAPIGRAATPEEIANVAVFLASSDASFIVGQTISPNGGFLTS